MSQHISAPLTLCRCMACASRSVGMDNVINGYTIQFSLRAPCFSGVIMSDVPDRDSAVCIQRSVLSCAGNRVPAESKESSLYSRYFLVLKKDGRLCLYSGLEAAELCVSKMLIQNDYCATDPYAHSVWFYSVNLEDAYFHIQIAH